MTNDDTAPSWELGDVIPIDLDDDDDDDDDESDDDDADGDVIRSTSRDMRRSRSTRHRRLTAGLRGRDEIPTFLIGIADNRG